MKLKKNWLNDLTSAARKARVEVPEHLPRTEARVLCALREPSASFAWIPWLVGLSACVLAMLLWPADKPLPTVSEAALSDLESVEWSPPSDVLLADATGTAEAELRLQITKLLTPR